MRTITSSATCLAKAILVDQLGVGVGRIVEASVDAAAHVFCETSIDVWIDLAEFVVWIY